MDHLLKVLMSPVPPALLRLHRVQGPQTPRCLLERFSNKSIIALSSPASDMRASLYFVWDKS